jgi:hypothetical protein
MNLELKPAIPATERQEDIIVNGEKVDYAKISEKEGGYLRYHVGFNLKGGLLGLIQGHGATLEEAVIEAIDRGRRDSLLLLSSIDELAQKLAEA